MAPATLSSGETLRTKELIDRSFRVRKTSCLMAKRVQEDHYSLLDLVKVLPP